MHLLGLFGVGFHQYLIVVAALLPGTIMIASAHLETVLVQWSPFITIGSVLLGRL